MYENAEEYKHPKLYDDEFGGDTIKYEFFLSYAKEKRRILDMACGTGLVSLYLASKGIKNITGCDILPNMIAHAQSKDINKQIDFRVNDALTFESEEPFDFIFLSSNAFQAFHTEKEQIQLLDTFAKLASPDATLIFEMRNPDTFDLSHRDVEPWHSFETSDGTHFDVEGSQSYDHAREIMTWTTYRISEDQTLKAKIECKFTKPDKVRKLLEQAGFQIVACFADWEKTPFNPEKSENIVFVCRKK